MKVSTNTKLICFGDSWTAGHGIETDIRYSKDASPPKFIEKLREQNSWPRWLSDKYNIPFINMGGCGWSNEWIYDSIKDCVDNKFLTKDDLIIVSFSYPYRFYHKNKYGPVEVFFKIYELLKPYNHYFFNSFYPLLKDELFDLNKLPKTFINPGTSYSDVLIDYEWETNELVWEYNKKKVWDDSKTDGPWGHLQAHPNLNGYKIIAEYIYNEISKNFESKKLF